MYRSVPYKPKHLFKSCPVKSSPHRSTVYITLHLHINEDKLDWHNLARAKERRLEKRKGNSVSFPKEATREDKEMRTYYLMIDAFTR